MKKKQSNYLEEDKRLVQEIKIFHVSIGGKVQTLEPIIIKINQKIIK